MPTLASITANDVTNAHRESYNQLIATLEPDLHPHGALEAFTAAEIIRANWRIQRLQAEESDLADQARRRARSSIRQDTAELRRLQIDRRLKADLGLDLPVLVSVKDYLKFANWPAISNESKSPKTRSTSWPSKS